MSTLPSLPAATIRPAQTSSPLDEYAKLLNIQGARQEQQIGQQTLELDQAKVAQAKQRQTDTQTVMQVMRDSVGDFEKALPVLYGKIAPEYWQELTKSHEEAVTAALKRTTEENNAATERHVNLLGLIAQAKQLPPEQYGMMWPRIAERALEIEPALKGHLDPEKPIPHDQLDTVAIGFASQAQVNTQAEEMRKQQAASDTHQAADDAHALEVPKLNKANSDAEAAAAEAKVAGMTGDEKDFQAWYPTWLAKNNKVKSAANEFDARDEFNTQQQEKKRAATTGATDDDVNEVAQGIYEGTLSPVMSGRSLRDRTRIEAQVRRLDKGYNLAMAEQDYKAVGKHLATLNGTQQERLRQDIGFATDSLDVIDSLYKQWQKVGPNSGFKDFNKAALITASHLPGDTGAVAQGLLTQINDLTSAMATVYQGGNAATNEALKLAQSNLKGEWNEDTFKKSMGLLHTNLRMRRNNILNSAPIGVAPDSPYTPPTMKPGAAAPVAPDGNDPRGWFTK